MIDFVLMDLQGPDNVTLLTRGAHTARALAALDEAGARPLERRQLRDLSGGQRVLIARARGRTTRTWCFSTSRPPRSTPPPSTKCWV